MKIYDYNVNGRQQSDGNLTITSTQVANIALATTNRITISKGTASAGTLAIKIRPTKATAFQALKDTGGSAVSVNLGTITEPVTYTFDGDVDGIQVEPTSVTGAFDVSAAGWE